MTIPKLPAVVINGTIGVGKSSLVDALSDLLSTHNLRHANLDLDSFGQLYPPLDSADPFSLDLTFKNLVAVVPNFIDVGARYFIIGATLERREQLEELRALLPDLDMKVCLLTASPATVAERIRQRELGGLLEDFLRRTDDLAAQIAAEQMEDFVVENEGSIAQAAETLAQKLGWLKGDTP